MATPIRLGRPRDDSLKVYVARWKGSLHLVPPRGIAKTQQPGPSFADLPGEIRNEIYIHALGVNHLRVPANIVRKTQDGHSESAQKDARFNILSVCHQIGFEAGTLFANRTTAYIPVSTSLKLFNIQLRIAKGRTLTGGEHTIHAALHDVKDLHLHLHFRKSDRYLVQGPIYQLSDMISYLAQAHNIPTNSWARNRRKITVHLDQYFAKDWKAYLTSSVGVHAIVNQMGRGVNIDWTLAYSVDTGSDPNQVPSTEWHATRKAEFDFVAKKVQRYTNIRLQVEVLGCGKWKDAEMPAEWSRCVTTDVTKQSTIWHPTENNDDPLWG
jgi:hypothetical protein